MGIKADLDAGAERESFCPFSNSASKPRVGIKTAMKVSIRRESITFLRTLWELSETRKDDVVTEAEVLCRSVLDGWVIPKEDIELVRGRIRLKVLDLEEEEMERMVSLGLVETCPLAGYVIVELDDLRALGLPLISTSKFSSSLLRM